MSKKSSCQCGEAQGACTTEFQYAVKIVCGQVDASIEASLTPVAPGRYWTAINIHNPDKCQNATFRWKVVVAKPLGSDVLTPVYQRPVVLRPDTALEIDCQQVMRTFPQPPKFVKGYVVIESDIELDVVAVYSGTTGCGGNSFHTERVQPRCVPVCEDLILPLHTGVAGWQTVTSNGVVLGPVAPITPNPAWATPPLGSSWVSQSSSHGTGASPGVRSYELCFNLCFGFEPPPRFSIQMLADDGATVYLNQNIVGSLGGGSVGGYSTPTPLIVNPNQLRAGRNCFRVDVNNQGTSENPTGFALAGILSVIRGKCPCIPLPIAVRPNSPGPVGLAEQPPEGDLI